MSLFSSVSTKRLKKNVFNLSHDNMLAVEHGQIVPCYIQENIIPGSHLQINQATLMRYQALLAPLQHHVNAFIHFWWIPTRLIDTNFPKFISGEMMRTQEVYDPPYFTYAEIEDLGYADLLQNGKLLDFLGYPIPSENSDLSKLTEKLSVRRIQYYLLPIYYKYINENIGFPNGIIDMLKNLIDPTIQGDQSQLICEFLIELAKINNSGCFPHAWQKDYFTSALPFVQLGDPVTLPLGGTMPITIEAQDFQINQKDATGVGAEFNYSVAESDGNVEFIRGSDPKKASLNVHTDSVPVYIKSIYGESSELEGEADLSEATAITINELRIANALQSLKEAYARFGTRYNEWLEGFFGVHPDDQTLQMPLWLGGGKVPVNIADIEQKSATLSTALEGSTTPLGTLAGKGTGFGSFKAVNAYFKEPGCVIGFLFVQPKPVYGNQGLNRFITKLDNIYDYFNPKTEHLGEQAVLNQELFYGDDEKNGDTFGYQSRYAEYKFMPSEVHGQFMDVLNFWHMARIFTERPTLSPEFIYTQLADTKRPFAVQSVEVEGKTIDISSCLFWLHFEVKYVAPMSRFGTPMLLN